MGAADCEPVTGTFGDGLEAPPVSLNASLRYAIATAQQGMAEWWALMEERGSRPDIPMKPQVVAWELGKRLRDDAIVCADSGTTATYGRPFAIEARVPESEYI